MKWANKHIIPVRLISMGRNIGYGGAATRVSGSVVIDLGRRMNKVFNIDGDNASCLVEPGVSYFPLFEEVKKTGYPLWSSTPDLGGGSVVGNALDRGIGYTPYGDHFANHCDMEIVLPDASVLRTGMALFEVRMVPTIPPGNPSNPLTAPTAMAYSHKATMAS